MEPDSEAWRQTKNGQCGHPGGVPGRSRMITPMRQAALRTLLVVSERPHPWAFLRDRLDPDLVTVSWVRPAEAGRAAAPWMLAGAGADTGDLSRFRDRLLGWWWVGIPPAGLPAPPLPCGDWHELAAAAERALAVRLAGVRLAPGRGLVLPDGTYLSHAAGLEALLGAHPGGLLVGAPTARLRAAAARADALLRRHRLPLRVAWDGGRLALAEEPGVRAP
jgi:hypothetical protein